MGYIYRYRDKKDKIIKYVGIVWSENHTLKYRIEQHLRNDAWVKESDWDIEYIYSERWTRTDVEYLESHFIALYETNKYYNVKKNGWGCSNLLDKNIQFNWENYNNALIYNTEKYKKDNWIINIWKDKKLLYRIAYNKNEYNMLKEKLELQYTFEEITKFKLACKPIISNGYKITCIHKGNHTKTQPLYTLCM